jgi:hypothetical protein
MTRIAQPGVLFIAIGLLALGVPGLRPGTDATTQTVRLPFAAAFDGVSDASSVWDRRHPPRRSRHVRVDEGRVGPADRSDRERRPGGGP